MLGLTDLLKVQPDQLTDRVGKLVSQLKAAEKQIADLKSRAALADVGTIVAGRQDLCGRRLHRPPGRRARPATTCAASRWRSATGSPTRPAVVAVVGGPPDKPAVVIVTTQGARDRGLKAGELVRTASETLGGRGGGKDDIAQGGGTDGSRAPDASSPWRTPSVPRCSRDRGRVPEGAQGRSRLGGCADRGGGV